MGKNLGAKINYEAFLDNLDKRLEEYFKSFGNDICCRKGCSSCCEKGDYPVTDTELEYLMKGYSSLEGETKIIIQNNIKSMKKGGKCPFLINGECSVYKYRPIICRVHGLAYLLSDGKVKVPYCANEGKNFAQKYSDGYFNGIPINANLETSHILEGMYNEIKNLYDWISKA